MRDDQLRSLLRETADRLEPALAPDVDLARQARSLDQRFRRRCKSAAGGIAGLALVVIFAWREGYLGWQSLPEPAASHRGTIATQPGVQPIRSLAAINRELDVINSELRISERVQALVQRDRQLAEAKRAYAQDSAIEEFRIQVDIVARQMLMRADELREAMDPNLEAAAIYRRLIELFPRTRTAQLAQARLDQTSN